MPTAVIGIGSNVGNKIQICRRAIALLQEMPSHQVVKLSSWYDTVPIGYKNQPNFINAVLILQTIVPPFKLLEILQNLECKLGRKATWRNGPRPIDLDLILYDNLVIDRDDLTVPHPRFTERAFVLIPLVEIWPDLNHPVYFRSMSGLLDDLGSVRHLIKKHHHPEQKSAPPHMS